MHGPGNDYEDILKETELDSAKMVLRLTSELREKEIEVASTRSRSFDEIQRNNKAKEAEFEALMRAQEDRIAKREQDLARLLVEKESALWQKYQAMLDDAITRQREEFEAERDQLKTAIDKKEVELAAQKRNLRSEMETLFKKWETEREADFKVERETFIEELKLGRTTAQKEALERARQMEELWRQKLSQQETDYKSREALSAEEIRSQMRRERIEELKTLNDRLNGEFSKREQELYAHYAAWLEENKKLAEEKAARHLENAGTEYRERLARLEDSLGKAREDLASREKSWEVKYAELKTFYVEKEAGLETAAREMQSHNLARERELSAKQELLARALKEEAGRAKDALLKKEKDLEQEVANARADFAAEMERRQRAMEEREAKLSLERGELAETRAQIGAMIAQKQGELEKTLEERSSLFRQSLEESFKIRELSLAKKYEDIERQHAEIIAQKDASDARITSLLDENARLKNALMSRNSQTRGEIEAERGRLLEQGKKLEEDFQAKTSSLKEAAQEKEAALRAAYAERLRLETARLEAQLKIKEDALERERGALNKRAAELETGFLEALRTREAEVTENFRRNSEALKAQAEKARRSWEEEKAALAAEAEQKTAAAHKAGLDKAAGRDTELRAFYENRENLLKAAAEEELKVAEKNLNANFALKERALSARTKALEEAMARNSAESQKTALALAGAREELELLTIRLEDSEKERQKLIQENLNKAKDLRQTMEREFLEKMKEVEQNYLGQLTDLSRRAEESRKADQDEYFRKLQFVKDDFNARTAAQAKEVEEDYLARERNMTAALDEAFKLKQKALEARQAQLESSYQSVLSEKAEKIETDRSLAQSVGRLKEDLETKNSQLKETIRSYDTRLGELETKLRGEFEARKKELEDSQRMRASQLEMERAKLKNLLEQEQELVTGLQKRETALQDSYAAREAELARRFKEARERLEKDYQDRLKDTRGSGA